METIGRKSRLISEFGKPSAVNDTAAYIAPDAPREGSMSITGRLPRSRAVLGTALDVLTAAAVEGVSWDTSRGNNIRVAAIWETSPEKRPAKRTQIRMYSKERI